jgi:hypothetical protein
MSSPPPPLAPWQAGEAAYLDTRRSLFPVRPGLWLTLGFLAFLEKCGSGVGGPVTPPLGPPGKEADVSHLGDLVAAHVGLITAVAALILLVVVFFIALATWIGSRATFLYMDAVASGRPEMGRSWRDHAERAQSLFAYRFVLAVGTLLLLIFTAAGFLGVFLSSSGILLLVVALALIPVSLALVLSMVASLAFVDFVAPMQRSRGIDCGAAVDLLMPLIRSSPGSFLFYLVLKLAFRAVVGFAVLLGCCLSCGCATLPILVQAVFQPFFFFERAWSMRFVEQMGFPIDRNQP